MTNQNNAAQAANKEIREAFELSYAMDADDPASATDLSHFTNGWRACIMSQVGKPVVMKLAVDATAAIDLINAEAARLRAPAADERAAFKKCHSAIIKALSSIARADGPDTRKEDDPELLYRSSVMDDVVRIRVALDECSAALARAPAAEKATGQDRMLGALATQEAKDGIGALDALYDLAIKHGASKTAASGFAHVANGAFATLEGQVHDEIRRRSLVAPASAPVAGEALGWRVRERRSDDGKLLDCFVEAPAAPGMAYAQEVLGDDYAEAQGGIEGKLKHCQMIVAWANAAPQASAEAFDFAGHLARQAEFSALTFGPGARVAGVCDHIRKELIEVETSGGDLKEWVDVIILGLDGAWRSGATPQEIITAIVAKQAKNEARTWPDWRTVDPNKAIEHDRGGQP